MSQAKPTERDELRAALRKAATGIQTLKKKLAVYHEPIAIIGMGCRFPGQDATTVATPAQFWHNLHEGVDAISEVPATRWDHAAWYDADRNVPSKTYVQHGGFIGNIDQFSPAFFGVSPREAGMMDPQHRLLLETAWEALESANIPPETLYRQAVGVFVGYQGSEYVDFGNPTNLNELYAATGTTGSTAAGRIAYLFGFTGPCLTVDTACSSSLAAVHLACQSLRQGECHTALAGGVNLMLSPALTVLFSKGQMLAPDGRCKTFDAAADGYVRSEGCGVVTLKRLSDAQRDGDLILAVIRGSAMNQDGASGGLTVPNGPAQEQVIKAALKEAGIAPEQVGYVEAHGTGTALGDPIEMGALGAVFGQRQQPLYVGSVKTNIGHLEAAAGMAGLMKLVLSLQAKEIPPNLHFKQPSSRIAWHESRLQVPTCVIPWALSEGQQERIAGVSSFGYSGTNTHVVLSEAPALPISEQADGTDHDSPPQLFTLSAKTPTALKAYAQNYAAFLSAQSPPDALSLADVCHTTHVGRSHFAYRLGIVASSITDLQQQLLAYAANTTPAPSASGGSQRKPRIAFLFTGQGSQYVDMGKALYASCPTFRTLLDSCEQEFQRLSGQSLLAIMFPVSPSNADLINDTTYTQPALFALEYALAKLWQSWGIEPDVLIGHSVGEVAAACFAGLFSLEDGLRLIEARARLMGALPQDGAMVALLTDEASVRVALRGYEDKVAIATLNSATNVVISGESVAVQAVVTQLSAQGVKAQPLTVSHAFHSPLMEPMLDAFRAVAESIRFHPANIPLVSNLHGCHAGADMGTADYWVRHVRQAVRFADGMTTLQTDGVDVYLEIGPKPVLLGMASALLTQAATQPISLFSLRKPGQDWQTLLASLSALYVRGATINWAAVDGNTACRKVVLPTYPFQRESYWLETRHTGREPQGKSRAAVLPLIDTVTRLPTRHERVYEAEISLHAYPFLADHQVYGQFVVPGAGHVAMLLNAARLRWSGATGLVLEGVLMPQALVLPDAGNRTVQAILTAGNSTDTVNLVSFASAEADTETEVLTHLLGSVAELTAADIGGAQPDHGFSHYQQRCKQPLDIARVYEDFADQHILFGACFRWLEAAWLDTDKQAALAKLRQPEGIAEKELGSYQLHPSLLDACFQVAGLALDDGTGETRLPFSIRRLVLQRPVHDAEFWCHARQTGADSCDILLWNVRGELLLQVEGFGVRRAPASAFQQVVWHDWLYQVGWQARAHFGLRPDYLQTSVEFHASLTDEADRLWLAHEGASYQHLTQALEKLAADYILLAFSKAGHPLQAGQQYGITQLIQRLAVTPLYERLLRRLLDILASQGVIRLDGDHVHALSDNPISTGEIQAQVTHLAQAFADKPEFMLLNRCAPALLEVMQGRQDPLALLFPDGDATTVNRIYTDSPSSVIMNGVIRHAIAAFVEQLPSERGVRILEIGAGTGGTTAGILPLLPADRTQYVFTDQGKGFLHKASQRFAEYGFMRYQPLDIEQSPLQQGFGAYQADLIIASNVLHATQDLSATLRHARLLLQPGGRLVLFELTQRDGWVDLTFGLTESWWRCADSRTDHPLLSGEQWSQLLQLNGFDDVQVVERDGKSVIIARAAEALPALSVLDAASPAAQRWLILADKQGIGAGLAQRLQQAGQHSTLLYADQLSVSQADLPNAERVVNLWGLDIAEPQGQTNLLETVQASYRSILHSLQSLLQAEPPPQALWLVTRGTQSVSPEDTLEGVAQSGLWGVGKVVTLEYPEPGCVCIDLDAQADAETQIAHLYAALTDTPPLATAKETLVALRESGRYLARLEPSVAPAPAAEPLQCDPEASYLITGGLGGLGLQVAEKLAQQGARHLLLSGRSSPTPAIQPQLDKLTALGVTMTTVQADVTNREQVKTLLQQTDSRYPLRGIVHCVGGLDDRPFLKQDWDSFTRVLSPKMQGAWNLHELTQETPLDFFVLFSSAASLLGNQAQANYAAANAFLDGLAHYRRKRGLPALSINWGVWSDIGIASKLAETQWDRLRAKGFAAISPDAGIAAFDYLMTQGLPQVGVVPLHWERYLAGQNRELAFYQHFADQLPADSQHQATANPATSDTIRQQIAQADPAARPLLLQQHVAAIVAKVLGMSDAGQLDIQANLSQLGLDSLMQIELTRALSESLDIALPATVVFDHPSVISLSEHLAKNVLNLAVTTHDETPQTTAATQLEAVARTGDLPLSFVQRRYWFHQATDPKGCFHNTPWLLQLRGRLDITCLQQCLNALVSRHEILRTTFPLVGEQPVQHIHTPEEYPLLMVQHDLRPRLADDREQAVANLVQHELQHAPFDLAKGPLLRVNLIRRDEDHYVLLMCQHHIINDVQSLFILTRELWTLYQAFQAGQTSPLLPLPVQYADYAVWQQQTLDAAGLQRRHAYWQDWLAAGEPSLLALPTDRPRQHPSFRASSFPYALTPQLSAGFKQTGQQYRASPLVMGMSALAVLLYRYSGCTDIIIGTTFSYRENRKLEVLVGPLTSVLQVRLHVQGNMPFNALLEQTRERLQQATAHQDVPFQHIANTFQLPTTQDPSIPFFRVLMTFFPDVFERWGSDGLEVMPVEMDAPMINRPDLAVWMSENRQSAEAFLQGLWRYREDLFDKTTVEHMAADFEHLLAAMIDRPTQSIDELPLLYGTTE